MTGDLRSSEIFSGSTASMPAVGWWEGMANCGAIEGRTCVLAGSHSEVQCCSRDDIDGEGVLWEKDRWVVR